MSSSPKKSKMTEELPVRVFLETPSPCSEYSLLRTTLLGIEGIRFYEFPVSYDMKVDQKKLQTKDGDLVFYAVAPKECSTGYGYSGSRGKGGQKDRPKFEFVIFKIEGNGETQCRRVVEQFFVEYDEYETEKLAEGIKAALKFEEWSKIA